MTTAAIMLRTGLPGAGKTLFTIDELRQLEKAEPGIQVYFSGIADLRVPGWIELEDPTTWPNLPPKSVLVIDEAQRIFRPRAYSAQVPPYVSELETIRHKGIRLFIITQHPKLVESNLRRLCGSHVHYVRPFGSKTVAAHAWGEVNEDPDKSRSDSLVTMKAHPVEVYELYKSAEVHTVKRRIPARLLVACCIPVLIAGCVFGTYRWFTHMSEAKRVANASKTNQDAPGGANAPAATGSTSKASAPLTTGEWIALQQPRIPGLLWTAPVYDTLMAPKQAPTPAGCATMGTRCSCFTDQATPLDVPEGMCEQVVERGYFQSWRAPAAERVTPVGGTPPPQQTPLPLQAAPPSQNPRGVS